MRVVDLFSGAGGLSLGFQQAGFNLVLAVDNWDAALTQYRKYFKHDALKHDLHDVAGVVNVIKPYEPDIIIGGPPCQDFSEAGSRKEGARAQLTSDFASIVSQCQTDYFVMENVARARHSKAYKRARKIFVEAGYALTEIVLDACYCGVPQRRKRFFCIGAKHEKDGFLSRLLCARQSDVAMTLRDYFGNGLSFEYYYRHPRTYARRGVYSIDEPAATIRGANRPMPKNYQRHPMDAAAPHRHGIRALTVAERAKIQMFPDDYPWSKVTAQDNQMIGNAVPVGLAEFVAKTFLDYFSRQKDFEIPLTFMEWTQRQNDLVKEASRDVLSRYRRARKILGAKYESDVKMQGELVLCAEYKKLSKSIQRQLLHSCDLHIEYMKYRESLCSNLMKQKEAKR